MQILPSLDVDTVNASGMLQNVSITLGAVQDSDFLDILAAANYSQQQSITRSKVGDSKQVDGESFTYPGDSSLPDKDKGVGCEDRAGEKRSEIISGERDIENGKVVSKQSDQGQIRCKGRADSVLGAGEKVVRVQPKDERDKDVVVAQEADLQAIKNTVLSLGGGQAELRALDDRFSSQGYVDFSFLFSLLANLQGNQIEGDGSLGDSQLANQFVQLIAPVIGKNQGWTGAEQIALQQLLSQTFSLLATGKEDQLGKALMVLKGRVTGTGPSWMELAQFLQSQGVDESQIQVLKPLLTDQQQGTVDIAKLNSLIAVLQEFSSGVGDLKLNCLLNNKEGTGQKSVKGHPETIFFGSFGQKGAGQNDLTQAVLEGKHSDGGGAEQGFKQGMAQQATQKWIPSTDQNHGKSSHPLPVQLSDDRLTVQVLGKKANSDPGQVLVKGVQDLSLQVGGAVSVRTSGANAQLLTDPEIRSAVFQQVETSIYKAYGAGRQELSLELHPPDLGKLDLVLRLQDKGLSAVIKTTDPDVAKLIQHNISLLQQGLEQQGIKVHKIDVQTQLAQDHGFQQWFGEHGHNQAYDEHKKMHQDRLPGSWIAGPEQGDQVGLADGEMQGVIQNGQGAGVSIFA